MTGFDDLPNEIILELWHNILEPDDIASFAQVSSRIFALATPFLKEYHLLKSKYSKFENDNSCDGSMYAHLLKDVLLNPHIAFYVKELYLCDWRTCWEDPSFMFHFDLDPEHWDAGESYVWHLPYPEEDMELFRNGIRQAEFILPSEVDPWIQLLESGHEDPIIVLLLNLLPNLRILSLEDHPGQTLLLTTIRRIAETSSLTPFSKVKSFHVSDMISDQHEGVSLVKPFILLPAIEKMSCEQLDNRHQGHGIPYCSIAPRSSNVTELIFDLCGDMANRICVLLEGMKSLKKFTYVVVGETVDAFWIRSALLSHCRHSLEYLKLGFNYGESNYMGSLRLFEKLEILDVEHSLLVDPDAGDDHGIAELLPTSIDTVDWSGKHSGMVGHIRPFTRSLVAAKRTRLPNLKRLNYHLYDMYAPFDLFDSYLYFHVNFADMYRLCERNGVLLNPE